MSTKLIEFFKRNDLKIIVILAILLSAFVGFRAGQSHQKQFNSNDLDISINKLSSSNPSLENVKTLGETLKRKGIDVNDLDKKPGDTDTEGFVDTSQCALIGSKNSDKYHLLACESGRKIKSTNIVCFSSEEDARTKGYQAAKCCH